LKTTDPKKYQRKFCGKQRKGVGQFRNLFFC